MNATTRRQKLKDLEKELEKQWAALEAKKEELLKETELVEQAEALSLAEETPEMETETGEEPGDPDTITQEEEENLLRKSD